MSWLWMFVLMLTLLSCIFSLTVFVGALTTRDAKVSLSARMIIIVISAVLAAGTFATAGWAWWNV